MSVFTMIINGELPGRFVWSDERCVAFLTINPLSAGHTLVVPRAEVDHWIDLDADDWQHLSTVAQHVGRAIQSAFSPERVATIVAGFEVPHVHIHVFGADVMADLDFALADTDPDPTDLDAAADAVRSALREAGHSEVAG